MEDKPTDVSSAVNKILDKKHIIKSNRILSEVDKKNIVKTIWIKLLNFFSDKRIVYGMKDAELVVTKTLEYITQGYYEINRQDSNTQPTADSIKKAIESAIDSLIAGTMKDSAYVSSSSDRQLAIRLIAHTAASLVVLYPEELNKP
jgi:hypothetical protein